MKGFHRVYGLWIKRGENAGLWLNLIVHLRNIQLFRVAGANGVRRVEKMYFQLVNGSTWNPIRIQAPPTGFQAFSTGYGMGLKQSPQFKLFTGQHQNQFRFISIEMEASV
jgi:hypothetical protein